jgi:hypothetical protein
MIQCSNNYERIGMQHSHSRLITAAFALACTLFTGCLKNTAQNRKDAEPYQLSISVKNTTQTTLYATCFSYLKKEAVPRWRWYKTKVQELLPGREIMIPIETFPSKARFDEAYGILGVFHSWHEADRAIYELTPDENKIDLDRLSKLEGKTILLGAERYGIVGDIFDYSFIPQEVEAQSDVPELDFSVENQTGKPIFVTAFIYQKKEDMPIWRYDKSPIARIEHGESALIDVDTITNPYDRKYTRGHLAVFGANEEEAAKNATFQLLKPNQLLSVGLLSALRERKVILKRQKYGIMGDVIDFTIKNPRKIKFSKRENIKTQPRYS